VPLVAAEVADKRPPWGVAGRHLPGVAGRHLPGVADKRLAGVVGNQPPAVPLAADKPPVVEPHIAVEQRLDTVVGRRAP